MSAERKDYVVLGNDGEPCPTCGRSTEIREHAAITQKQLRQQCYYSRWFVCTNPMCHGETDFARALRHLECPYVRLGRIIGCSYCSGNNSPLRKASPTAH